MPHEHATTGRKHALPHVGGKGVRVTRDEGGDLRVRLPGRDEPVAGAKIARCFPWSRPETHISIRTAEGKEAAILESLADLDVASRRVVEEELARRVFNPRIQQVLKIKHEFEVTSITAVTDRGQVDFQIRSRDDVRVLSPTRALFRDVDGNTYELPDLTALDPASRKRLEVYF